MPDDEPSLRDIPDRPAEDPFDLEITVPYAIAITELYRAVGKRPPKPVQAAVERGEVPVLVQHNLTPFYKAGKAPTGVWGMGYEFEPRAPGCVTLGTVPGSVTFDVMTVSQQVAFGVSIGGQVSIGELPELPLPGAPGSSIQLQGAKLHATTDQQFAVAIEFALSVLEVQAGPIGAGGARWNLYRGRRTIETNQPLFHTVLVPDGTNKIPVAVKTWVRRSGRFFGLIKPKHWDYPEQSFEVLISGLPD